MPAIPRSLVRLCLLALIALQLIAADVIELTAETFETHVDGSSNILVEFYAPWCGHCKNLAPEWKVAGETFQAGDDIKIAALDATAANDIAQKYGVRGYPTIKFFPKGSTEPEDYEGGRTAGDIIQWVNKKVGTSRKLKVAPSNVVALSKDTFYSTVSAEKHALVEFYAPWCGHCKSLAPEYEKLANAFAGDADVVVAKVDATEHGELASSFGVEGYPTLKFFAAGSTDPENYEGPRTAEGMLEFLNQKAGTARKLDGTLEGSAGRVAVLDGILAAANFAVSADVLAQLSTAANDLKDKDAKHAKVYLAAAEKVVAKGADYVTKEIARLTKVLGGANIKPASKSQFLLKVNVLRAFLPAQTQAQEEEL